MISIPISTGELLDKVTILQIKLNKVTDVNNLQHVKKEYKLLKQKMCDTGLSDDDIDFQALLKVNLTLWEIEDNIRLKEKSAEFDDEFIQLARQVYIQNDQRASIKRKINKKTNSELMEIKTYADYTRSGTAVAKGTV